MIIPAQLRTRMVEKIWGRADLPAPFAARASGEQAGALIGEIWFEPPREFDRLLVKYLFTNEKLSVQVHPSDAQAQDGEHGKEECWLVLDAVPGAQLGIGFKQDIAPPAIAAAALDGSIEDLLDWHTVKAGDFFYLPAGTVHAIGPGLSLIEIQQNSDTTFRLFDYGRPRDLHLERGVAVANGGPHDPALRRSLGVNGNAQLAEGPHFRADRIAGKPADDVAARYSGPALIMPLEGVVNIGAIRIEAGECGLAQTLSAADFAEAVSTVVAQPVV